MDDPELQSPNLGRRVGQTIPAVFCKSIQNGRIDPKKKAFFVYFEIEIVDIWDRLLI